MTPKQRELIAETIGVMRTTATLHSGQVISDLIDAEADALQEMLDNDGEEL